jgi:hypothetical protein
MYPVPMPILHKQVVAIEAEGLFFRAFDGIGKAQEVVEEELDIVLSKYEGTEDEAEKYCEDVGHVKRLCE